MADDPPDSMKRRAVRSRTVQEIVMEEMGRLLQDAQASFRDFAKREGAMNPRPMDETLDVLQGAQFNANIRVAQEQIAGSVGEYHPGFNEAD